MSEHQNRPKRKRVNPRRAGKAKAAEVAVLKRRESAFKLHLSGWNYRDIAAHLGCSIGTVSSDVNGVLDGMIDDSADRIRRARAMSLARLDKATKGIWPGVESGDYDAVDRLVKIENRRAKLEGTDRAEKTDAYVHVASVGLEELDQLRRAAEENECSSAEASKTSESGSSPSGNDEPNS